MMRDAVSLQKVFLQRIGIIGERPAVQEGIFRRSDLDGDFILDLDIARNQFGFGIVRARHQLGHIFFVFHLGSKEAENDKQYGHQQIHQPFVFFEVPI